MRTNVVIDDQLMSKALKAGGFRTKKSAIEAGLRLLTQRSSQDQLLQLKGRIRWDGDLAAMRRELKSRRRPPPTTGSCAARV